ncbi:NAD(P)/FAD-dependent oxidoreductase [Litorilituus lipolyticus]|uniref:NAD(P)/FAD-dependent oxidoreductase n=1 Tax=Litorilituus lipolyticus TaxID=2491017 RepID=A0A502KRQ7_9GAMM|nr:NAD(P)/FAD-dependent oxidoreductase [Litorilituus lipolyticus]TPH12885.1 NAD(P)/FAD-dependent oxidoreductase [Litorilituus lipolyticus]
MYSTDVLIIGSGVVGLAIAAKLSKHYKKVLVIDKNQSFGEETSSRNSEVIHAGIYYPANSLKATLCVKGKSLLYEYCNKYHIPINNIGKLLVATNRKEEDYLAKAIELAKQNNVDDLSWVSQQWLKANEPSLGVKSAILSPSTGIVDSHQLMLSFLREVESHGGQFVGNTKVLSINPVENGFISTINSLQDTFKLHSKIVINSAGLHSVELANNITSLAKKHIPTLHYCRGCYFSYQGRSPINRLVYPVPSAHGLGIHTTLDMAGGLKFGPDTQYLDDINYDCPESLRRTFYSAIKNYLPDIEENKLQPAYAGIRPKLQGPNDEAQDFMIQGAEQHNLENLINLFGIESPGLTSSLAIANLVFQRLER